MRTRDIASLLLGGSFMISAAWGQGYYLCLDAKTGRKVGQDRPCATGSELSSYAPATAAELKAREAAARQSKRDFERSHPGTYAPEEYMTEEELAAYRQEARAREAAEEKRAAQQAVEAATRKAAQAEQRALDAEVTAREAKAKAAAAEEAAARLPQPVMLMPRLPAAPMAPRQRCESAGGRERCIEDTSKTTPFPTPSITPRP